MENTAKSYQYINCYISLCLIRLRLFFKTIYRRIAMSTLADKIENIETKVEALVAPTVAVVDLTEVLALLKAIDAKLTVTPAPAA